MNNKSFSTHVDSEVESTVPVPSEVGSPVRVPVPYQNKVGSGSPVPVPVPYQKKVVSQVSSRMSEIPRQVDSTSQVGTDVFRRTPSHVQSTPPSLTPILTGTPEDEDELLFGDDSSSDESESTSPVVVLDSSDSSSSDDFFSHHLKMI